MEAPIDTSGRVRAMPNAAHPANWICWSDLSPFTQGYVEAALRELVQRMVADDAVVYTMEQCRRASRFHALAPVTLARMIEDCARKAAQLQQTFSPMRYGRTQTDGANFWRFRQHGDGVACGFPCVALYVADDWLIYARRRADDGARIEGSATVKSVQEYQDEKQTTIRNPRWKEPS